jgi:hypothetical protein
MKAILALVFLTGCATTYELERCEDGVCYHAKIRSYREFQNGAVVRYDKHAGTFEFEAGKVSTAVSPLEEGVANLLMALPSMLAPTPTIGD